MEFHHLSLRKAAFSSAEKEHYLFLERVKVEFSCRGRLPCGEGDGNLRRRLLEALSIRSYAEQGRQKVVFKQSLKSEPQNCVSWHPKQI